MRRAVRLLVSGVLTLGAAYVALLAAPYPLFAYQAGYANIRVYSDRPIPPSILPVLSAAEVRLEQSPINDPRLTHRIFICNDTARFTFFTTFRYQVGGVNYGLLNQIVFLRPVNIEHNRLISPTGREVAGERTLVYFLAHEMTHSLEVNYLGRSGYWRLPQWKREGYADVVGRGGEFNFAKQLAAFQRGDVSMDYGRSGLYLRFQLMVAYLMERKGVGVHDLLDRKFDAAVIERELRNVSPTTE